jgi:hypothetical protein
VLLSFCTEGFSPHGITSCARTVSALAGSLGAVDRRGGLRRGGPYEFRWLRVELLLWLWRVFPAGSGVISGPPQAVTYFVLPDQLLNARGDIAVRARDNDDAKNAMVWL